MINRDRNLRLQYLAGLGLNLYQSDRIYSDMISHAHYPEGLFTGSDATLQTLREAIARVWRVRDDRYSDLRTAATADLPRVEMFAMGG